MRGMLIWVTISMRALAVTAFEEPVPVSGPGSKIQLVPIMGDELRRGVQAIEDDRRRLQATDESAHPCSITDKDDDFLLVGNDECCDLNENGPCELHGADCDSDAECMGDLMCGVDNCPYNERLGTNDDCCFEYPICECTGNQGFSSADTVVTSETNYVGYDYGSKYGNMCAAHDSGGDQKSDNEPWCYIACDNPACAMPTHSTAVLWNATLNGVDICYSYENCGGVDYFSEEGEKCTSQGGYFIGDFCSCDLGLPCKDQSGQDDVFGRDTGNRPDFWWETGTYCPEDDSEYCKVWKDTPGDLCEIDGVRSQCMTTCGCPDDTPVDSAGNEKCPCNPVGTGTTDISVMFALQGPVGTQCQDWDMTHQNPECMDPNNKPAWCEDLWCYVDKEKCAPEFEPKSSFYLVGTELVYSYKTCGKDSSFDDNAKCSTFKCPNAYFLKSEASSLACGDRVCYDSDRDTCCEPIILEDPTEVDNVRPFKLMKNPESGIAYEGRLYINGRGPELVVLDTGSSDTFTTIDANNCDQTRKRTLRYGSQSVDIAPCFDNQAQIGTTGIRFDMTLGRQMGGTAVKGSAVASITGLAFEAIASYTSPTMAQNWKRFAFYFTPSWDFGTERQNDFVTVGGYDEDTCPSNGCHWQTFKVLPVPTLPFGNKLSFWAMDVLRVNVGDKTIDQKNGITIIDTGASNILMPNNIYVKFMEESGISKLCKKCMASWLAMKK
jgi:hypothetical protein